MGKNNLTKIIGAGLLYLMAAVSSVSAHVVVRPAEVGLGQRLNFSVSVPTEEDVSTTIVRLVIPEGLTSVRPNVKPGWTTMLSKSGEGDAERVTEIIWRGGQIPPDMRDEFIFSAAAPSQETILTWKAYQTYANGTVVAWDADPSVDANSEHGSAPKPYSQTKVVNDLAVASEETNREASDSSLQLAVLALVISGISLGWQIVRRKAS